MRPAQFSRQCCENLRVWEHLRKLHHASDILFRVAAAELRLQLVRQCPRQSVRRTRHARFQEPLAGCVRPPSNTGV